MGVDAQMFAVTKENITDEQVLALAIDLYEAFGDAVWPIAPEGYVQSRHCLEIVNDDQGGLFGEGEIRIEVYLRGRYYGIGYERGNLPVYIMIARWLEDKLDCGIWYGGDCGAGISPFDEEAREELWKHFLENGHRPYYRSLGSIGSIDPPECKLCKRPMRQHGAGRDGKWGAFHCDGCGWELITENGGETFEERIYNEGG